MTFSLEDFHDRYDADASDLVLQGRRFRFFVPRSLDPFLDPQDPFYEFPLWAKIWEPSIVLADHLATLQPDPGQRVLEIGCGVGVVGTVAAVFGHRVTMTENNEDALNFARANALANLPPEQAAPAVVKLDWKDPKVEGRFNLVVGSEVIYRAEDFQPIEDLISTYLAEGGEVILAEGLRKTSMEFFERVSPRFQLTAHKKVLRSKENEVNVILCRMKPRLRG